MARSAVRIARYKPRAYLNESGKIFGILPTQLLAIVHPIIGLEDGVNAKRPCAEDRVRLERAEDRVQARITEAP